ncbi:MAG: hypothetical protein QGF00_22985, partial [Planctomycetota bacterium]|nr:hypothetical protein [Planctomycetota bacterium]
LCEPRARPRNSGLEARATVLHRNLTQLSSFGEVSEAPAVCLPSALGFIQILLYAEGITLYSPGLARLCEP